MLFFSESRIAAICFMILCFMPFASFAASTDDRQTDLSLPHHLTFGECEHTTLNGQLVKVCRDSAGTYKVLPADNAPAATLPVKSLSGKIYDSYQEVNAGLLKIKFCDVACASNMAHEYIRTNNANFISMVENALAGDEEASTQVFRTANSAVFSSEAPSRTNAPQSQQSGAQYTDAIPFPSSIHDQTATAAMQQNNSQQSDFELYHSQIAVGIFVLLTSLWVLIDARRLGVKEEPTKAFFNIGRYQWFFGCLLLWIVVFPAYLFKRREYTKGTNKSAPISASLEAAASVSHDLPSEGKSSVNFFEIAIILLVVLVGLAAVSDNASPEMVSILNPLCGLCILGLGAILYFIPSIVAYKQDHKNKAAILVCNFIFGWSGIGWGVTLVWAFLK